MTGATILLLLFGLTAASAENTGKSAAGSASTAAQPERQDGDRSGKKRRGEASYYGREFVGKPMADGTAMDPKSDAAASRSLPLGTRARVKNLDSGKSAEVEIRDRGPYVEGRIIDVTPKTAEQLDMKEEGVAPVEVTPIELPPPDGKNPAAARDKD